jgi:snurportin-1
MRGGVGAFASMLHNQPTEDNMTRPSTASSSGAPMEADAPTNFTKKKGRKKRKAGKGNAGPKPSRYADKCMYAELLEMREGAVWGSDGSLDDSLPQDLEFGWVTVAPVPAGKRCLVVTYQSSGVAGVGERGSYLEYPNIYLTYC